MAETFRTIGYPPSKVRYLVNRADSSGGIDPNDLRARARPGARSIGSCPTAARRPSNNEGVPFVLADPRPGSART